MTVLGRFTKQPAEVESYSIDFSDDLGANDGVLSEVTTIEPAGLTKVSSLIVGNLVKVTVSGGTVNVTYKVTITVTTDDGRVLQDEFVVKIKDS